MRLLCTVVFLGLLTATLPAQAPARASIRGVLVRWGTAEPVEQATVELRGVAGTSGLAVTATRGNGEFEFANVAPGNYRIVAMAFGFTTSEYGQLRPNGDGRSVRVGAGEQARVRVGIVPGGIIAGKVTDQNGRPQVYSRVQVFRVSYDSEGQISPAIAQETITNDLGEYRVFWLSPGQYLVAAGTSQLSSYSTDGIIDPRGSDTSRPVPFVVFSARQRASAAPVVDQAAASRISLFATVYYANAVDARSADVIELRAGGEVSGADIHVSPTALPANPVQLRGVVVDPSGAPVQGNYALSISSWPTPTPTTLASVRAQTSRVSPSNPAQFGPGAQVYAMDEGKFDGAAVRGVYQIRAGQGDLSGRVVLDVGNRDLDVKVQLRPSVSVQGRVVIEGAGVSFQGLQVGIRTPPAADSFDAVAADGQFLIERVIPGDYQVYVPPLIPAPPRGRILETVVPAALQNAYVKTIRSGTTDLTNGLLRVEGNELVPPLEIVIGLGAGSLAGRVLNAGRLPVNQATVVLLPEGVPPYRSDRYKTLMTDESGKFQFKGIPPGNYRLLAWEDVDPGAWFNAAFLGAYERYATPLQILEGQHRDLDLAVIPVTP